MLSVVGEEAVPPSELSLTGRTVGTLCDRVIVMICASPDCTGCCCAMWEEAVGAEVLGVNGRGVVPPLLDTKGLRGAGREDGSAADKASEVRQVPVSK